MIPATPKTNHRSVARLLEHHLTMQFTKNAIDVTTQMPTLSAGKKSFSDTLSASPPPPCAPAETQSQKRITQRGHQCKPTHRVCSPLAPVSPQPPRDHHALYLNREFVVVLPDGPISASPFSPIPDKGLPLRRAPEEPRSGLRHVLCGASSSGGGPPPAEASFEGGGEGKTEAKKREEKRPNLADRIEEETPPKMGGYRGIPFTVYSRNQNVV